MAERKIVKMWRFEEKDRASISFSDSTKVELDSKTNTIKLKRQGFSQSKKAYYYSTQTDLYVTIQVFNPKALVQWLGFGTEPFVSLQPAGTSLGFKLNDGTSDRYWDGAAWSVAGASDWNTEAEVSTNISSFPASSKKLSVVINLKTTDKFYTPSISSVAVLMLVDISYLHSLVADSLVARLMDQMRPHVALVQRADGGTTHTIQTESPYNIVEVPRVYNQDTDPQHQTNLAASFDPSTSIITLTGPVTRSSRLWIVTKVEPEVYINWASQDYIEVEKIPAVVIDQFETEGHDTLAQAYVKNAAAGSATLLFGALRQQITFDVLLLGEGNRDLMEMWDHAQEFIQAHPVITWDALDEEVSLVLIDTGNHFGRPNLSDKHQMRFRFQLRDVYLWLRPSEEIPLVTTVVPSFNRQLDR